MKEIFCIKRTYKRSRKSAPPTLISQGITDLPPVSEEEVWFKTVGGRKRGRIYGVGRVSAHSTPSLMDGETTDEISTASEPDLREQITRLNRELTRQFELVEEERTKYPELEAHYQAEHEEWKQTHQRQQQEIKRLDSNMFEMKSSMGQMWAFM
ncbi:hypothetical protein PIB30_046892 [Stylosanthes scabra]|uniref:Uncharacterized protein n=1 Tax=Stylosanthes scabra TaxID=79078 RepID=A0ABU6TGB8_9FABA|nr:hypothetical protein [Stylosanthes scabra]